MTQAAPSWLPNGIDERIHDLLARRLQPSQLWSLLLNVVQHRASERTCAVLLQQYERDRFVKPS
jgi:hypothetical protein